MQRYFVTDARKAKSFADYVPLANLGQGGMQ
jgi:hypothetical protein